MLAFLKARLPAWFFHWRLCSMALVMENPLFSKYLCQFVWDTSECQRNAHPTNFFTSLLSFQQKWRQPYFSRSFLRSSNLLLTTTAAETTTAAASASAATTCYYLLLLRLQDSNRNLRLRLRQLSGRRDTERALDSGRKWVSCAFF